jgi:hypothetical protein
VKLNIPTATLGAVQMGHNKIVISSKTALTISFKFLNLYTPHPKVELHRRHLQEADGRRTGGPNDVNFIKTGFTCLTDFTVVLYSKSDNGPPYNSQFRFQGNVVKFNRI